MRHFRKEKSGVCEPYRLYEPDNAQTGEIADSITTDRLPQRGLWEDMSVGQMLAWRARRFRDWNFHSARETRKQAGLARFAKSELIQDRPILFSSESDDHIRRAERELG